MTKNEWQPRETAPKDGTRVLVYGNQPGEKRAVHIAFFNGRYWIAYEYDTEFYSSEIEIYNILYWMPLPNLPEEKL